MLYIAAPIVRLLTVLELRETHPTWIGCAAKRNCMLVMSLGFKTCLPDTNLYHLPYGLPRNIVITNQTVHFETCEVSTNLNHRRKGIAQNCGIAATKDNWFRTSLRYVRITMFMTFHMVRSVSIRTSSNSHESTRIVATYREEAAMG